MREKECFTFMIVFILLFGLGVSPSGMETSDGLSYENSDLERQLMENISIGSEKDLREFASEENYDLPGNGTEENPFLLKNYTINGMGENYSVYLKNIELHFIIRNCKIYNSSDSGIKLYRVANFTLENSVVKSSSDNTDGVTMISSENILIKSSSILENDKGIYLGEGANNNTITDNNISDNNRWGIHISESNHNLIYHNIFYENHIRPQAYDEGDNQWDRGDPRDGGRGGNYWSDYDYGDRGDGIGNESYVITEDHSEDEFPLIYPIGPPTNVRARPVRDEYVELTWGMPRYSIRYPVEEMIIYRGKERGNLSAYDKVNSSVREFRDENVNETETYHYAIKASNEKHVSMMSETRSAQPETTRPEVENVYPLGEDAPIDPTIKVEFSEEMRADSIQISMEDADGENIALEEVDEGPQDIEFYFVPKDNLSYETRYEVSVNGSDIAQNWLESPYTWSFTTVSDTGMIRGRVTNEEGEPLENVKVYVDEDHQTFTNASGGFQLEVPSGNITFEFSRGGHENREKVFQINQSDVKTIDDVTLREQEGIISRWFWPMALAGGGILLLGILALFMSFYDWGEEEPPLDEDIYEIDYEDVDQEEFESWWEDEDS